MPPGTPALVWPTMPGHLAPALRPRVEMMAEEMVYEIRRRAVQADRPLAEGQVRTARLAAEVALGHFVDLIDDPHVSWSATLDLFREVGRLCGQDPDAADGRGLDTLQQTLRLGARVAWRILAEESERLAVTRGDLGLLAEAIFAFLDEISEVATEGYAQAREVLRAGAESAGEVGHLRLRLLDLLLSDPPAAGPRLTEVAAAARWRLPRTVAAVALAERDTFTVPCLPPGVLADLGRREPCLLLPDPDISGQEEVLRPMLRDWTAVVGPAVPLGAAAKSLRWARETLALVHRGVLRDQGLVRAVDHFPTLVVFKDEELVRAVAAHRLAPLLGVRPRHRERLARTFLACLECGFNATEVATRLDVHPQTVRYRLHQLEELFGQRLHDPATRLEFEIVLHAWLAMPGSAEQPELSAPATPPSPH